jgi:hypothetical protein
VSSTINAADIDLPAAGGTLDSVSRLGVEAGFDAGPALIYGTVGAARATVDAGADTLAGNGYFYGVGVDYAVTDQVVLGAELLRHEFDDFDNVTGLDVGATTVGDQRRAAVLIRCERSTAPGDDLGGRSRGLGAGRGEGEHPVDGHLEPSSGRVSATRTCPAAAAPKLSPGMTATCASSRSASAKSVPLIPVPRTSTITYIAPSGGTARSTCWPRQPRHQAIAPPRKGAATSRSAAGPWSSANSAASWMKPATP